MSKQLNASCDFQDGLLVGELPKNIVEVILKVKTRWGKHTLIEDQYSRTEKFCPWDRGDRRIKINTKRKRMPQHTQGSNNDDMKNDSVKSTDSGTYVPTDKGFGYPPLIFTDPEFATKLPDRDTDSVTEGHQISRYVGNYCEDCVTKWPRCIFKAESDWDDDHTYTFKTQMDSPSNVKSDKHPIPSDWSNQENFWNGKAYEKSTGP